MSSRAQLVGRLSELMRRASTYGLLIHQAIADQLGLIPTDLKCLDAARGEHQLTAGRLAEITGLSTSATTAALDRNSRELHQTVEKPQVASSRRGPNSVSGVGMAAA